MTDLFPGDRDVDIADAADSPDADAELAGDFVGTIEANPVDIYEQKRAVPQDDEDRPAQ